MCEVETVSSPARHNERSEHAEINVSHTSRQIEQKLFAWWTLALSSLGVPPTSALDSTLWLVPRLYRSPLTCRTPDGARSMTCETEEDCNRTPAEVKMHYSCKEINLTTYMQHPDHRLPQLRPDVELSADQSQLFARIPQHLNIYDGRNRFK
ncbi:hypothetical protein V3C99_018678 [Haemonchus contortus]|uniref:Phlebovirus_G2 domain-containing protein n=1 Tax=Haemonchus contortus TaxID=6289 RepID=A0A7I4Z432_HAECO